MIRTLPPRPSLSAFLILSVVLLKQDAICSEGLAQSAPADTHPEQIDFEQQIWPILQSHCLDCHGADTQEGHLRLDRRWAMLRGGGSGEPAIHPGSADDSYLVQLISGTEPGKTMPPADSGDSLSPQQIQLIQTWIDQGADWPGPHGAEQPPQQDSHTDENGHWSFRRVQRPPIPSVPAELPAEWQHNPIDAFIARGLTEKQLQPSQPADRAMLIRRLSLDLLGLPPTPDAVRHFVNDSSPDAWNQLVDQMLASPHYGERRARYWLDLVRFAETDGYETNRERPHAWPFRDYVIRAFNDDLPYDQFLREQLAGDALGVPQATAYLVAGPVDIVKSPDIALTLMQRQNELDDMINVTSTAFLGLTVGCARCHNHKFDPIRQTDYYGMQAIFAGVQHGNRTLPLTQPQQRQKQLLEASFNHLQQQLRPFLREGTKPRPPVSAAWNEERFEPVTARFIRFTITATNGGQPCVDELEIFSGETNVALATHGAVASCSSALPGYEIHKLEHIHDGQFGNSHSWISNEPGAGWVCIELPQPTTIDRIVWARDREQQFRDRLATEYQFEVSVTADDWATVASSIDRQPLSEEPAPPEYDFAQYPTDQAAHGKALLEEFHRIRSELEQLQQSATVYAGTFESPPPTFRLFRGEPMATREQVDPAAIAALTSLPITRTTPEQQRRLALASWIASADNPLTARVIVNRIWQWHFGNPLVNTPSDFGLAGVRPSHPELLDWLASELVEKHWSLKQIQRLILTSATYQQSSQPRTEGLNADAGCQFLWRFPARRLEAEPIRDSILAVTGLLDLRIYGPGFSAFEVELENVRHYFPKSHYAGDDFRRMIYMTKVRQEQDSVFGIFDCPDAAASVPRRNRSTTPLQALNLLNSSFILQQASQFATRLQTESPVDICAQVTSAFWLCFSRDPDADELADSITLIESHGLEAFCRAMLNSNEFLFLP